MKRIPTVALVALASLILIPKRATAQEMIDPASITVTAGSNFDSSPDPVNRFHETNTLDTLLTEGNRDAHQGTHWLALNGTLSETITFDLGAAYTLTEMKILNTSNTNWNDSETDTFTIATSTDGGGTFSAPSAPIMLQDFDLGFQDVPMAAAGATHVQLVVTNDGVVDGDPLGADAPASEARVGLNEVQFFHTAGADSDDDGMIDEWEIENFDNLSRNGSEDEDVPTPDGLTNKEEHDIGTDPKDPDTDDDTLTDAEEVNTYSTNPLEADSDGDTLSDADEVLIHGSDPNIVDSDGDTLTDAEEVNDHGTDPSDPDTDGDGLSDADEINVFGTDPLVPNNDPRGTQIDPATITVVAGSHFDETGTFDESNTLDDLLDEGNRDAHRGTHWLAANGTFTETITFDLGGTYTLSTVDILNTSNTNWNDSETDRFTIATSADGGNSFSAPSDEVELQDFSLGFQSFPVQLGSVTHVQLVVTNDGDVDGEPPPASEARVGLNEVRFFTGTGRPFIITSVARGVGETTIEFNSNPGAVYAVDYSTDLSLWLEADDGVLATTDSTSFTDSDPDNQAQAHIFYRVRQIPN